MTTIRGRMPLAALALVLAATGQAGPALAQSTAKPAATAPDPETRLRRMEAEIRGLQRKVFPDGAGKTFVPEITPGEAAAPVTGPSTTAVTDLLARMDAVEGQLSRLTAQVEEGQNRSSKLEARLALLEAAAAPASASAAAPDPAAEVAPAPAPLPAPAPAVEKPVVTTAAPAPTPRPAAITPAAKPVTPSAARVAAVQAIEKPQTADAGEDNYTYGYRLWEAKFYPEAQQQLATFADQYPKHKRLSYARNLLGRAYLDDGKPGMAAQVFLQNYLGDKKGDRAPDSLLYLGVSMVRLKDTKRACGAFDELAASYPTEISGRLKGQYEAAAKSVKCN